MVHTEGYQKTEKKMDKKLVFSDLKEVICTVYESEIQEAIIKQIGVTGYTRLTFVYIYDENGAINGATITFHYKHEIKAEKGE